MDNRQSVHARIIGIFAELIDIQFQLADAAESVDDAIEQKRLFDGADEAYQLACEIGDAIKKHEYFAKCLRYTPERLNSCAVLHNRAED